VKQLSSRWVVAALLAPVLIIFSILITGTETPQASTTTKGFVQLSFTGSVSATSGLAFQSLLLNVISVRVNASTNADVSEADPGWQIIAAPVGTTAGESLPSLTTGGNFGPNGNSVSVGQAQSELQIDLALLQNSIVQFNIGKIKAITYNQIELLLDPSTPGYVVPQCGVGNSVGEGCVAYPLQFAANLPNGSIRTTAPFTVTRNTPQSLVLDISAVLGAGPTSSTSVITFTPSICAVPASGTSACPATPFTPTTQDQISAIITDTVTGATSKTVVNAERSGTSQIVASSTVFKQGSDWEYTMILPAPAPSAGASPALYDIFTTTASKTQDPHAAVPVFAGIYSSPIASPSPDPFAFNIAHIATRTISGVVFDACTGVPLPGATLELYAPASIVGTQDCTVNGAAPCTTTCGNFVNNPVGNDIPAGCVIVGTTSTTDLGTYPIPGSAAVPSPFSLVPLLTGTNEYALSATTSGYNGELLGVSNKTNSLQCLGSLFHKSSGQSVCNFSLQHGNLALTTDIGSAAVLPTANLNVLVNVEDHGTSNGEAVGMVTIPAGQPSNSVAVSIPVPISPPTVTAATSTTASPTPTPVVFGGAATYDLYASVQDLFGSAPQKVSGHQIAVVGDVAAPAACAATAPAEPLTGLACVGHGSIAGTIASPDANTLVVVSKFDSNSGDYVDLMSNQVPLVTTNPNFAICAPADSYNITHYEATPGGTPIAGASVAVSLATPIILNSPVSTTTPTPVPCTGICSDFSQSSNGQSCYLCQTTAPIPNPF
jgi:hypothetical protein